MGLELTTCVATVLSGYKDDQKNLATARPTAARARALEDGAAAMSPDVNRFRRDTENGRGLLQRRDETRSRC